MIRQELTPETVLNDVSKELTNLYIDNEEPCIDIGSLKVAQGRRENVAIRQIDSTWPTNTSRNNAISQLRVHVSRQ